MPEERTPPDPRLPPESRVDDADSRLLFEEADPLLGRRVSVADAHDRYADSETQVGSDDRVRAVESTISPSGRRP